MEQAVTAGWLPGRTAADGCARVVPLPGRDAPVGVLLVARRATRWYDEADTELVRAFAARAGAALATALLNRDQAEVADTLQASLVPVEPAEAAGVQWGTAYRPAQAGLRIGGDFYGSHRLPDGGSVFFLGDVSGKGVEAAVRTGQLRQCLQALHRVESHPGRLLKLLNDALLETTQAQGQGRFATMVLGVVRPQREGGLTLTSAAPDSAGGAVPPGRRRVRQPGEAAWRADRRGAGGPAGTCPGGARPHARAGGLHRQRPRLHRGLPGRRALRRRRLAVHRVRRLDGGDPHQSRGAGASRWG